MYTWAYYDVSPPGSRQQAAAEALSVLCSKFEVSKKAQKDFRLSFAFFLTTPVPEAPLVCCWLWDFQTEVFIWNFIRKCCNIDYKISPPSSSCHRHRHDRIVRIQEPQRLRAVHGQIRVKLIELSEFCCHDNHDTAVSTLWLAWQPLIDAYLKSSHHLKLVRKALLRTNP